MLVLTGLGGWVLGGLVFWDWGLGGRELEGWGLGGFAGLDGVKGVFGPKMGAVKTWRGQSGGKGWATPVGNGHGADRDTPNTQGPREGVSRARRITFQPHDQQPVAPH